MKLTKEQKQKLKEAWGDWEVYHGRVDDIISTRLRELDPEFMDDLDQETKGATFWFA